MSRPRPTPGFVCVYEVRIKVCKHCGYAISDVGGLCSYGCDFDTSHKVEDIITAVYERTDKFVRDEPGR